VSDFSLQTYQDETQTQNMDQQKLNNFNPQWIKHQKNKRNQLMKSRGPPRPEARSLWKPKPAAMCMLCEEG
jgi:hypothetical protein